MLFLSILSASMIPDPQRIVSLNFLKSAASVATVLVNRSHATCGAFAENPLRLNTLTESKVPSVSQDVTLSFGSKSWHKPRLLLQG